MANELPDNLIKYCSADEAVRLLTEQSLRWSSPERFANPFEANISNAISFDVNQLLESTIKLASSMIFAHEQPKGDTPLVNAIRRWRQEERFSSPEEASPVLRELLSKMVDHQVLQLETLLDKWQTLIRTVRVCCFCRRPDLLAAWEQFGDNHRGIAIRFNVTEFSCAKSPRAVVYQTERPEITTLKEQLGAILYNRKDIGADRLLEPLFVKAAHHKHEEEWRCVRTTNNAPAAGNNDPDTWYDDIAIERNDISAVYFGLNTPSEVRQRISALLVERYGQAKTFQAVKAKTGYQIELQRIGKPTSASSATGS